MKYFELALIVLLATFVLSGCKQEISSTFYVRDLVNAVSSDKDISTSAAIKLEMPSSKSCGEKKDELTRIISPFFINLEKIQCIREGSDAFYYAAFDLPMVKVSEDGSLNGKYKGGVSAQLNNNNSGIGIYLAMKLDLLSALDKNLRNDFNIDIDPEDMKVKISIHNDAKDTYTLFVEGAFLDGQAIIPRFVQTVELENRSESVITLANVSVFALTGRGKTTFAYVGTVAPKKLKIKNNELE